MRLFLIVLCSFALLSFSQSLVKPDANGTQPLEQIAEPSAEQKALDSAAAINAAPAAVVADSAAVNSNAAVEPVPEPVAEPEKVAPIPKFNSDSALKSGESYEYYAKNLNLLKGELSALNTKIAQAEEKVKSSTKPLAEKSEFETTADFEKRKKEHNDGLNKLLSLEAKPLLEKKDALLNTEAKLLKLMQEKLAYVEVKTNPKNAKLTISKNYVALTDLSKGIEPGEISIKVEQEGFKTYESVVNLKSGKNEINAVLEKKSIFGEDLEINYSQILKKDTNTAGYKARIVSLDSKKPALDKAANSMRSEYKNSYPPIGTQKDGESLDSFVKRSENYNEKKEQDTKKFTQNLSNEYEMYLKKVNRAKVVLNDYIIQEEVLTKTDTSTKVSIFVGPYNADNKEFSLSLESLNEKIPYEWNGNVFVPIDDAKVLDKSSPGISVNTEYLNSPFLVNGEQVFLATKNLVLFRNSSLAASKGTFKTPEKYASMSGFAEWKGHADSLLQGKLKPQNLDEGYVLNADYSFAKNDDSGDSWTWRAYVRIISAVAAGGAVGYGIYENGQNKDRVKTLEKRLKTYANNGYSEAEKRQLKDMNKKIEDSDTRRNVAYIGAGTFAGLFLITFAF